MSRHFEFFQPGIFQSVQATDNSIVIFTPSWVYFAVLIGCALLEILGIIATFKWMPSASRDHARNLPATLRLGGASIVCLLAPPFVAWNIWTSSGDRMALHDDGVMIRTSSVEQTLAWSELKSITGELNSVRFQLEFENAGAKFSIRFDQSKLGRTAQDAAIKIVTASFEKRNIHLAPGGVGIMR